MDNKIGKFIATLRKEAHLTQQELGTMLHITDKAISKWERGLSLPDISLLTELAKIFEVDVTEILQGAKSVKKKEINEILKEEKQKLEKYNQRKLLKIIIPLIIVIILLLVLVFKNIYLGYEIKEVRFAKFDEVIDVEVGVPRLSFLQKRNNNNYSFKNLRSQQILNNEVKEYLKKLKYLSCNNTIYYYDEKNNLSIIDYKINDNFLYSTISYSLIDGDYCLTLKQEEERKILGEAIHGKHLIYSRDDNFNGELGIFFIHYINSDYHHVASMEVYQLREFGQGATLLEESNGTYFIDKDKLIYYRYEIADGLEKKNIPQISVFTIKDNRLILEDNYLAKYDNEIILKNEQEERQ